MFKGRLHSLNCDKSNTLIRRNIRNTTDEGQGHSHPNERAKNHRDGKGYNITAESQPSKNESFPQKSSSVKNYNEHPQAAPISSNNQTDPAEHSKQQTTKNTTSEREDVRADYNSSASNSSSSPSSNSDEFSSNSSDASSDSPDSSSNSSDSSSVLSSKGKEFNQSGNNQTLSNSTQNNASAWISSANLPVVAPVTNSSSQQGQPLNFDQHAHDSHPYKVKVWCIGIVCLLAFICIGTAIAFAKKRLKLRNPAAFFRRRFRSNSNESNRAVRDRRSIGPQSRNSESDPFSPPSTFSRKPLILRPESLSYIRSSSPRRPSVLHLRDQSLKSQISPPILEPPSPADYQPLSGGSSDKARRSSSSGRNRPAPQSIASPISYHPPREYRPSVAGYRPSLSFTRDAGIHRGSMFPTKPPEISPQVCESDGDPLTERTPVPPRPPRPDFPLLPCSSVGSNVLSTPVEETEPTFPTILPLKVPRRSLYTNKHHRRQNSIDQVILDPPASYTFQDSPTLPQFHGRERNSVISIARGVDPARVSQLSRSTCYSQLSEQENGSIAEENHKVDAENHVPMRFMSFGTSRTSAKLEQQLDCFISKNM